MATIIDKLREFLDQHDVDYQVIHHRRDYSAQAAAQDTHTAGHRFVKPAILNVDGRYVMAVVPADRNVDLCRIAQWLDASEASLASELDIFLLFPDCEVGAEPPFGNIYGVPVYVDPDLANCEFVTFNGGKHDAAVRLAWADYERLVQPAIVDITIA